MQAGPRLLAGRGDAAASAPPAPSSGWAPRIPLFILYTSGSTGQAQGRAAHHRRLPGLRRHDPRARLRLPARRRLLLRGRRRLDHRPQLHRLRTAGQRRHHGDVRVDPDLSRRRAATGGWCDDLGVNIFYTAPTALRAIARAGDELVKQLRAQQPARAGHGGRAHQPRDLALVPRRGRRRAAARWWTPGGRPRPAASSSRRCPASPPPSRARPPCPSSA